MISRVARASSQKEGCRIQDSPSANRAAVQARIIKLFEDGAGSVPLISDGLIHFIFNSLCDYFRVS